MNKLLLRKIHRWLGLVAGIQLLAWTVSGLYFTLIPIGEIRGDHLLTKPHVEEPALKNFDILSPSELGAIHQNVGNAEPSSLKLTTLLGEPVYLLNKNRFNAITGDKLLPVTREQASAIVQARVDASITGISKVEEVAIDAEYRGGELPAWRIELDEEDAAVYVGMATGRIRAVRTNAWRLFDLLWSLHIMDYEERENFNHLLIQLLASLGLVTVLSGLVLFFTTLKVRTS